MGYLSGFGSGRYGYMPGQKRPKTTVEECLCLDIGWLHRRGMLTPGNISTISWSYTNTTPDKEKEDRSAGSIGIYALDTALKLPYVVANPDADEKREHSINVPIVYIPCNYGGARPYFTCPDCRRRVLKLYKPPSHATFSCRHCCDLTYRSCQDSGDDHARARAHTGRECRKLGIKEYRNCDDTYYKAYVMERPKGMHKKTFERLRQAVFEAVDEEKEASRQALYAFAERMRRRNRKARKMLGWKDSGVS
jgi:hypothetical protein